jgi:hypothetical protein
MTWRGLYFIKKRLAGIKALYISAEYPKTNTLQTSTTFLYNSLSYADKGCFRFLNLGHQFPYDPNWNFSSHGRLWTYNLNYFDFLMQPGLDKETALSLIRNYCENIDNIKDGLEPYPVSLRCMNWIKFIITHNIQDKEIDKYLWAQVNHLHSNLEYHLLGNHLLENAFSLTIASFYFNEASLRKKAEKLLFQELEEQILDDGAHFELSPMYHQIILGRLLDCINIVRSKKETSKINEKLEYFASKMIGWLNTISFHDGSIPLVNDSALGISPSTTDLHNYAKNLNINTKEIKLNKSGYRKFSNQHYDCFMDVGSIGPDYQPGHAHADTFSFVIYHKGKPFIVDTGTSTYEPGERRSIERSTSAHNTVVVNRKNSSQVWASHRVGKRAKVNIVKETENSIAAQHNGYKSLGVVHHREFVSQPQSLSIHDELITTGTKMKESAAFLHFAPGVIPKVIGQKVQFPEGISIYFDGAEEIIKQDYQFAPEFNKTIPSQKLEIIFSHQLKTTVYFENSIPN